MIEIKTRYPVEELEKLFKQIIEVNSPDDWKAPISIWVPETHQDIATEAIIYYTGTCPCVAAVEDDGVVLVSEGYRNGPCGDH